QKDVMNWAFSISGFNIINPVKPIISVMISWLILPVIVRDIAFSLLPSFMYSTLPRYSPTRFGVVTEKETPDNTARKAVKKSTCCTLLTASFHLKVSNDQLSSIRKNTATRFQIMLP